SPVLGRSYNNWCFMLTKIMPIISTCHKPTGILCSPLYSKQNKFVVAELRFTPCKQLFGHYQMPTKPWATCTSANSSHGFTPSLSPLK
ncbi:hypothetical protein VIGAN_05258800, partial [Vigna angularis var. angularis]